MYSVEAGIAMKTSLEAQDTCISSETHASLHGSWGKNPEGQIKVRSVRTKGHLEMRGGRNWYHMVNPGRPYPDAFSS